MSPSSIWSSNALNCRRSVPWIASWAACVTTCITTSTRRLLRHCRRPRWDNWKRLWACITAVPNLRGSRQSPAATGLNLRVSPNEIFQLLALTMMLAPTFDDAQEFGMFCQKQDQIVGLATLYGTTVVVEGTKHHFDRD